MKLPPYASIIQFKKLEEKFKKINKKSAIM
jgi:hypothetical protein